MSQRIFIENPPPFRKIRRRLEDGSKKIVEGNMDEGLETIRYYLDQALPITGFHHSDIDPFESKKLRGDVPLSRFNTFEYACYLRRHIPDFHGLLIPHRVGVYQTPAEQGPAFTALADCGIRDVVVVGMPRSTPPEGASYESSVPEVLAYLDEQSGHDFRLGVIGIHLREDEPERIAAKYRAAGGRLRVMGQFLDEADQVVAFIQALAGHFEKQGLDLSTLEYNVGLAMFGLKNRGFYAGLLQKDSLDCEPRFAALETQRERIAESVRMNLEFAERILEAGRQHGVDVGFSIQPLIERKSNGELHRAVHASAELCRRLHELN